MYKGFCMEVYEADRQARKRKKDGTFIK